MGEGGEGDRHKDPSGGNRTQKAKAEGVRKEERRYEDRHKDPWKEGAKRSNTENLGAEGGEVKDKVLHSPGKLHKGRTSRPILDHHPLKNPALSVNIFSYLRKLLPPQTTTLFKYAHTAANFLTSANILLK